jgi:NitT/TauT family transport system permease protein
MSFLATRKRGVGIARLLLVVLVLALLEILPRAGLIDAMTLVPLSQMVLQIVEFFTTGVIWSHLSATFSMVLTAFVLATLTGLAVGYVLWRNERASRLLNPYLTSYYALPVFAFYPVLIAIFGVNRIPIVVIAWAWAVVAVIVNTVTGFDKIKDSYHKLSRVYGLTRWQSFRRVEFPAAAPFVFNGIKLAASYSIIGVVASEFILATEGLGWLVAFHYNNFGLTQMYGAMLLVIVLTMTITALITVAERRIRTAS